MAGLVHRGSEQHHNLCDRYADSAIRIRPCQRFLHGTLREQLVGLAKQETRDEQSGFLHWPLLVERKTGRQDSTGLN
jgi:hypothetical protein